MTGLFRKYNMAALLVLLVILLFMSPLMAMADDFTAVINTVNSSNATWKAGETSVTKLTAEQRRKRLGAKSSYGSPASENIYYAPLLTAPNSLDWRSNGGNFVTPVRDQGYCGSCWAFASTAALESKILITTSQPGVDINLAEQILVSCSGVGDCDGGYMSSAATYLRNTGLPAESCYLYTATNGICSNACSNWQNNTYKIASYSRINSVTADTLKTAIAASGPVVVSMDVYEDFDTYISGIYHYVTGVYEGGHSILAVGYNDASQYFIVKNSWGAGWGEAGYFRIAFSEIGSIVSFAQESYAYGDAIPSSACYGPMVSLTPGAASGGTICQNNKQQYSFPVAAGGQYRVTLTPSAGNPDLYLHSTSAVSNTVYTFSSANTGTAVDIITFTATATGTYYAAVYGTSSGTSSYAIKVDDITVVTGDSCASAKLVSSGTFTNSMSTATATVAADDPTPSCGNGRKNRSVWYKYTPSVSGTAVIDTFGSNYDTVLSAYTGACGSFTSVGCNDESSGGHQSKITLNVTAGTTYYLMVSSYTSSGGTLQFNLTGPAPVIYAPCGNLPARISETSAAYASLQSAYNAAAADQTIQAEAQGFGESPVFNGSIAVKLEGGFNCDYSSNAGVTTINGSLTIKAGRLPWKIWS
jgi:C1A family cysteine protease